MSGSEMELEAGMLGKPGYDRWGFVRTVIVHDQVDVQCGIDTSFDQPEELQELTGSVASEALANDCSGGDVEGGEQARGPVAGILGGAAFDLSGAHGEHGLSAIEGLDLRLLVDRQHDGIGGGRQVEADHVTHFVDEVGIARKLEGFRAMWLQSEGVPDLHDRSRTDSDVLGHFTGAPARGTLRH